MCSLNNSSCKSFAPSGCQVPVGKGICGETKTLDIINEFKRLYEEKMQEIDSNGGGDCLQEKFRLQQEWIDDLTKQNEMLVKAVEELEHEATERVQILEEKLHQSAQCICEVMKRYREYDITNDFLNEPLQRVFYLENDKINLLEFIRRVREDKQWTVDGLKFYEVSRENLLGEESSGHCDKSNRYLQNDGFEVQKKVADNECTIQDLQKRIHYFNSFGDVEALAKELKCKNEECQSLKEAMGDMRRALTEEVATKHDTILQLKRDCQQLEDRCIQADKQTAFRDDIIKELRKEIKQLKQQLTQEEIVKLNETIDDLQDTLLKTKQLQEAEEKCRDEEISNLNNIIQHLKDDRIKMEAKFQKQAKMCKICSDRINVGFKDNTQVQTNVSEKEFESQMELLEKRDEIIRVQNNTLSMLQEELQSIKKKEVEVRLERDNNYNIIQQLKFTITELKNSLHESEKTAANLQIAVDLHLNSINVLEASKEKYKTEANQQKFTISNLQQALVVTKQMLDEIKQKSVENEKEQHILINNVISFLECFHIEREDYIKEYSSIAGQHEHLKELNFNLEVDYCNSLQEMDILETQLLKYQLLLRSAEVDNNKCKCDLKKIIKQKKCYEEVIVYFREEMALMAEQLQNLQELLTLSSDSAQEENSNVMRAFLEVQTANEKLSTQLSVAEQKVSLENQMNQMNESKICELEKMISEKEIDLTRHDQAILNIRQSLKCSLKQNEDLHTTIVALNNTILQLQDAIRKYESENCRSKESNMSCQEQITSCKQKLDDLKLSLDQKTTELCKLEMAYNNQNRSLQSAQLELKQMREKQKDKQCHMRCIIQDLREKLTKAEEKLKYLRDDYIKLQTQLGQLIRKDSVKDVEIKRYRKIIGDLKKTLMDLNKTLTNKKFQSKCNNAECMRNMERAETKDQDICLNCPCEVEFYQNIVETLKKTVLDLKKKLTDTQKKNHDLETEKKEKEKLLSEISKSQVEKEKEYKSLSQQLSNKIREPHAEETRYLELATQLEKELGSIRQELEIKTMQLNDVKQSCEEINSSRCVQLACAQEEVESLKDELNRLLRKHCALNAENEKLHNQSVHLQSTVSSLEEKSQVLSGQMEQYLMELQSVQNEKECLVQKNQELLSELRMFQFSYNKMDKQQRELQHQSSKMPQQAHNAKLPRCLKTVSPPPMCQSPWSLGSQGTASCHDGSLSRSPCPNEEFDWYSNNFQNESEDNEEEDWVSKVEDLAAQVRRTNKMWKNKLCNPECPVSKDIKK